jgi:hypothetical protein
MFMQKSTPQLNVHNLTGQAVDLLHISFLREFLKQRSGKRDFWEKKINLPSSCACHLPCKGRYKPHLNPLPFDRFIIN